MRAILAVTLAVSALSFGRTDAADREAAAMRSEPWVDLSLLVAQGYPCTWADRFPPFQINHDLRIGRHSAYNRDILTIDGNTGTQLDVPPHSVAKPEHKLPNSGPLGEMFTDKVPAWQLCGEACVIDVRELLDSAPNGRSPLITKEHVVAWEKKHRPLRFGDVVLFRSDYSDKYYRPLPEGRRFLADPLERKAPGWPDPDPACMEYLASHKVMAAGTDSPSMGPIPDLAEPTHYAGLKYGMIWTEGATGLANLSPTGSFYCMLGPKHAEGPYSECRAFGLPASKLAERLIESAREKRAADLSVVLSKELPVTWPGVGVGNHRQPYWKVDFLYAPNLKLYHHTHMMDSHAGTHLVPPSYALPPPPKEARLLGETGLLAPEVRAWLEQYESKYGPRGTSDVTTEKVPIAQTCGPARVIDVRHLVGTTNRGAWPASPEITPAQLKKYEAAHGELKPGDIVIFQTGHSDKFFKPGPQGDGCFVDPLNGKSEGWPAPGPDAIRYLSEKKIRCVATDAPTLGGVEQRRALFTYWSLGTAGLVGVEFLTGVGQIPAGRHAYFLFAPVKIRDCHGGPGRAIALY